MWFMQFIVWPAVLPDTTRLFWIKMFSSIDILSASYGLKMMEKRVHKTLTSLLKHSAVQPLDEEWLSAAFVLLKSGRCYTALDLLFHVSSRRHWNLWLGWSESFFGIFKAVESTQDTPIWLAHVERTVGTTSSLIGPWVGWRAAVSVAMALIHARPWGRRERKKETQGGWCWWSFY